MATFALIHGGGSSAWDWHLVSRALERAGHSAVAVDLPIEDAEAKLEDYADTVAASVAGIPDVIVVGHSLGGFTAPLVCDEVRAIGLVYLAGMIPNVGEGFGDWWTNTGHDLEVIDPDENVSFFNGVPEPLAREARARTRDQQGAWMTEAWPGHRHPDVPTQAVLCADDRFFPASFMRRQIRERLGAEALEIPGGHYAALSHPREVAAVLERFAADLDELD